MKQILAIITSRRGFLNGAGVVLAEEAIGSSVGFCGGNQMKITIFVVFCRILRCFGIDDNR